MKYLVVNYDEVYSGSILFKTKEECLDYINRYSKCIMECYTINNGVIEKLKYKSVIQLIN